MELIRFKRDNSSLCIVCVLSLFVLCQIALFSLSSARLSFLASRKSISALLFMLHRARSSWVSSFDSLFVDPTFRPVVASGNGMSCKPIVSVSEKTISNEISVFDIVRDFVIRVVTSTSLETLSVCVDCPFKWLFIIGLFFSYLDIVCCMRVSSSIR
jgi:hypothetical protein